MPLKTYFENPWCEFYFLFLVLIIFTLYYIHLPFDMKKQNYDTFS